MEPTIVELFSHTHKLHGKENYPWVDKKSQQTYVSYSKFSIFLGSSNWILNFNFINCNIYDFLHMLWYWRNSLNANFKMQSTLEGPGMTLLKIHSKHFQMQMSYGWRCKRTKKAVYMALAMRLSTLGKLVTLVLHNEPAQFSY